MMNGNLMMILEKYKIMGLPGMDQDRMIYHGIKNLDLGQLNGMEEEILHKLMVIGCVILESLLKVIGQVL